MTNVRLGYRQLFDALGFSLDNSGPISIQETWENSTGVAVYLGPEPKHGKVTITADEFLVPGRATQAIETAVYEATSVFLEVVVSAPIEIDGSQLDGLATEDSATRQSIFSKLDSTDLVETADVVCGLIGLRFQRQLVLKQLMTSLHILDGPCPANTVAGPALEVLEACYPNANFGPSLESIIRSLGQAHPKTFRRGAKSFYWLARAWRSRDHLTEFLLLFVALESLLRTYDFSEIDGSKDLLDRLSELVGQARVEEPERDLLLAFLVNARPRFGLSLRQQFDALADEFALPGAETDKEAVKSFNRMRNQLLHDASRQAVGRLELERGVRTLEDIVERYAARVFLGDSHVYSSRWRPPQ